MHIAYKKGTPMLLAETFGVGWGVRGWGGLPSVSTCFNSSDELYKHCPWLQCEGDACHYHTVVMNSDF